jgi:hypothetical protein
VGGLADGHPFGQFGGGPTTPKHLAFSFIFIFIFFYQTGHVIINANVAH